jgi:adenylate cyclase
MADFITNILGGTSTQNSPIPFVWVPTPPTATLSSGIAGAEERFEKRLRSLNEILPITDGRVVPGEDDLMIGDARRLSLAVMFLDICQFSETDSEDKADQEKVLKVLNLFMAEMLSITKRFGGHFEKNTGDGLMTYFKESTLAESAKRALDAAITMHHYNDHVISPRLKNLGLPEVKFRVGIEAGPVVIANVGVRGGEGDHRSLVAIGNTANIACKLMTLIPHGGIVLGARAQGYLPSEWQAQTTLLGPLPKFFFRGTTNSYTAWELKYRAPSPTPTQYLDAFAALGRLGQLVGR